MSPTIGQREAEVNAVILGRRGEPPLAEGPAYKCLFRDCADAARDAEMCSRRCNGYSPEG